ncbi:MAG: cob(I)yrinic acid a,c-diamide adenosyltransferase [Ignavibacteria bacterium]|nr:cob(I)yrinic acid a,c-diamide adenosyltransferase [Ignavibacteria bacterium]
MKIYTRRGDEGETGLFGGQRVPKDDLRIEAYGTVDELNAVLGVAAAGMENSELTRMIGKIQSVLFEIGADLATPVSASGAAVTRVSAEAAKQVEEWIDHIEQDLDPLKNFILPGGSPSAARLHHARTVCRRAERRVVTLSGREKISKGVIVFLNRLSDFLFVLAREENRRSGTGELPWKK